jgi:O-antigen/teichoic acid export membrane protein
VRRSIIRFSVLTLVLAGLTVAATELALPVLVPRLFGKAFDPAIGVARILLVSALIFALRRVLSECARGAGRPLLGSVAEVVCLIVLAPAIILLGSSSAKGVATALVVVAACGLATIIAGLVWGPPRWLAKRSRGVAVAAAAADGSATSIVE